MGFKDRIFAVVDLETTGSSYKNGDRIIQIGITFVQHNTILQEYDFKVNPGKKIPLMIEQLTGISNADVKDSPYFEDIAEYVFNLLEECVFVAHNIGFDYRFLSQSFSDAGLQELTIPGMDTVELTKILYPTLDSYRLSDLSRHFELTHLNVHDAAGDARATAELLLQLQEKAVSLPLVTLEKLNQLSNQTQRNNADFFAMCLEMSREQRAPLSSDILIANSLAVRKVTSLNEQTDYRAKEMYNTEKLWQDIISNSSFQSREGQSDMMTQIEMFLNNKDESAFAIEAPAGFGKTLAYVVPAILRADPKNKVIIATSTLLLQEQLETVMIGLQKTLPFHVAFATLSSRKHLISLDKVEKTDIAELRGTEALVMMSVFVWLTETETGNLSELSASHRMGTLLDTLTYDFEENDSRDKERHLDYFTHHQKKAKEASILITNHAYLSHHFEDIKCYSPDGALTLIVDEAHRLASIYKDKEKVSFPLSAVKRKVLKFSNVVRDYREHLEQNAKIAFPHYELINLEFAMDQVIHTLAELEVQLAAQVRETQESVKEGHYLEGEFIDSAWFRRFSRKLLLHFEELKLMEARFMELEFTDKENPFTRRLSGFLETMETRMSEFHAIQSNDFYSYYSLKVNHKGDSKTFNLEKSHWDIGEKLQKEIKMTFEQTLYISATLLLEEHSHYFSRKIGLDNIHAITYTSQFEDQDKKIDVFIPTDIGAVTKMDHHEWLNMLTKFVFELVSHSEKKILVLFNSNKVLEEVLIRLRNRNDKEKKAIEFLAQGFSGSQRRVHRRFLEAEQAVLLGSGSYWEGVDFPDQPVEVLVMTRLPFDPPDTPENRAIEAYYREVGGANAFRNESLPKMIMRLIQGMGRISRNPADKGIVYCLDTRLVHSPYAKQITANLPSGIKVHETNFEELFS